MSRYNKPVDVKQQLSECFDYSGPISSTLHSNQNSEAEFCDFYALILQKLHQKFQTDYKQICKALYNIKTYREPDKPTRLPVYEKDDSMFAYVFSFGIIHSMLMYDRFRDMVKKNPPMLKKIFSMSELNICLLGGGPAFEAAAICKFLKKAIAIFKPDTSSQLRVHVAVIDVCAEWETVVECLFTTLQNDLYPLIQVDFRFVPSDLTEELSPAVIQEIESSYIVLMFKFVNEVFDRCGSGKVEKMIKGIVDVMSFESCLFFLDNAGGGNFRIFDEIIKNIPTTTRFYGPELHHCKELNEDTVEKYSFFIQDIFKTLKCSSKTTISCSAWLKINPEEQDIDSLSIPENVNVKKIKKKEKKMNNCKEKGSVEQDIKSTTQKNTDVKNNLKKEINSCKQKNGVELDTDSSTIPKNTDSKNNHKKEKIKAVKSCKEKGGVKHDNNLLGLKMTILKKDLKKAKEL